MDKPVCLALKAMFCGTLPRRTTCKSDTATKFSAWLTALLLSWAAVASAQQYSVVELPYPAVYPPNNSAPAPLGYAINTGGEVTGFFGPPAGGETPGVTLGSSGPNLWLGSSPGSALFQYSNGVTNNLGSYDPTESGGFGFCGSNSPSVGFAINASAETTGAVCATTETPTAFSYQNGSFNLIEVSGALAGWGHGINSAGLIVGTLLATGGSCAGNTYHTFLYNSTSAATLDGISPGASQDMGTFFGCSSWGYAINDAGQIAGEATDSSGNFHGYLYSYNSTTGTGSAVDIGYLNCPSNPSGYVPPTVAVALNASGQVTGWSSLGICGSGPEAFVYSNGEMTDIGNLGGLGGSQGNAINASGQITGESWTTGNSAVHALAYIAGTMVDLNSQISSADAALYTLVDGVAINDKGQIVVQGYVNSTPSQTVTFLLTPLAPAVTPLVTGTLGKNGWYVTATTLSWYVTGTPAPTTSGCGKVTVPNTKGTTYTCSATNSSGSAENSVIIKRDTVAPAVTIKKPANNAVFALNAKELSSYTCTDATSGVATCAGTVADGTSIATSALGTQTFSVTATDNAGNTITKSVSYTVEPPTATPVFSLKAGTYSGPQPVTITDTTTGAVIYYTLDGTVPTTSSPQYMGTAITISSTETLKADALAPGYTRSAVRTADYTIK